MANITDLRYHTALGFLSGSRPHGHSIRRDVLGKKPSYVRPPYLFMVYITAPNGVLNVKYKEGAIDASDPESGEEAFLDNIINHGGGTTNPFDLIEFDRPTYFTIVIGQPGWDFYYPDPENNDPAWPESHDPIIFLEEKSSIRDTGNGQWVREYRSFNKNRAFYNSEQITVLGRPAFRCINYITKNKDGDMLEPGKLQRFSFNIFLRVPISLQDPSDTRMITLILDPDGQNQGPNTA